LAQESQGSRQARASRALGRSSTEPPARGARHLLGMSDEKEKEPAAANQWLVDVIVQIMQSPSWNEPLKGFVEEKCILFDNFQEENKHEYVEVHNEFKTLVDNLLAAHLCDIDIDPADFEKQLCDAGLLDDPRLKQVVVQLLAAEDFVNFKEMMIDRHCNMQHQAENTFKEISAVEDQVETDAAIAAAVAADPEFSAPVPKASGAPPATANAQALPKAPAGAPASPGGSAAKQPPTAQEERAFGAGGGFYGRAQVPAGSKKPATNVKAGAIRAAICKAIVP